MKKYFKKSIIPNGITAFNLFCGFLAIIFSIEPNLYDFELPLFGSIIVTNIHISGALIIMAAIFDSVDGLVARLIGVSSRFGVELDSLSDVVSFGAAPSFLLYQSYLYQFGVIGIIVSSLPLIFGTFRLANFNIKLKSLDEKHDFSGLPIPVSALTNVTFVLTYYKIDRIVEPANYFVIPIIIVTSILMVSKIRYNTLPNVESNTTRSNLIYVLVIISLGAIIILTDFTALFYMFVVFVCYGFFRYLILLITKNNDKKQRK
ncbi:MAG: CDP-diacylglycerol--serine O-phosphatidyltransferase [Ignavibacteriales bacterium]|nr:CDP-diacylglycerol--serine O-phosphatidyltransferase [Ignavibacteriales bacterium]